jgi:CO/xanthine dehydrogenase FAD-binding subunit
MRLRDLEGRLRGLTVEDARRLLADSKPHLKEVLDPVSDILGSAEYKITITSVLLGRAVEQAAASAN